MELKIYRRAKNRKAEETVMNEIIRVGRRSYLSYVQPGNITGIYQYIRKRDGGENRTSVHQCASPIMDNEVVYTDPRSQM